MILLLLACAAEDPTAVGQSAARWAPPWPDTALYLEAAEGSLSDLDGARDTASPVADPLYSSVTAEGDGWRWSVASDDDRTQQVFTFRVALDGDLVVTDGESAYSPSVVLLPQRFDDGDATTSGSFTTTATRPETVETWYGVFSDVVQIDIAGPDGDALAGQLRISEIAGPIQFVLGGVTADLAWYE